MSNEIYFNDKFIIHSFVCATVCVCKPDAIEKAKVSTTIHFPLRYIDEFVSVVPLDDAVHHFESADM